jgi:hypothetical protein
MEPTKYDPAQIDEPTLALDRSLAQCSTGGCATSRLRGLCSCTTEKLRGFAIAWLVQLNDCKAVRLCGNAIAKLL